MNVIEILLTAVFGTTSRLMILGELLAIVGYWKLFEKCGADRRLALIPLYREYVLSECAGREPEGRVFSVSAFFLIVFNLADWINEVEVIDTVLTVFTITASIVYLIYCVRIYSGLIEVYGVKKWWMLPWRNRNPQKIFIPRPIGAILPTVGSTPAEHARSA